MSILTIMAKAAMPCVLVGGGITAGASVEPIKRAVHRAHRPAIRHFKPMPRAAIVTPVCIEPIATSPVSVALREAADTAMFAAEPAPQRISQWAGSGAPLTGGSGILPYVPGVTTPDRPEPPAPPVSAVPEPSTWLTMLAGMALVAGGFRMRRAARKARKATR